MNAIIKGALALFLFLLTTITMDAQEQMIKESELPKEATTFLQKYFKDKTIHPVVKDTGNRKTDYEIRLTDGTEIKFTEKGEWKKVDEKKESRRPLFLNQS